MTRRGACMQGREKFGPPLVIMVKIEWLREAVLGRPNCRSIRTPGTSGGPIHTPTVVDTFKPAVDEKGTSATHYGNYTGRNLMLINGRGRPSVPCSEFYQIRIRPVPIVFMLLSKIARG